jgi:DNA (cytosine-5)-methyltransferase 1
MTTTITRPGDGGCGSLTVGSLFSGIGGIDLGLERAGMTVAWQCEIDPAAASVLNRWWPFTPTYDNVKDIDVSAPRVDVLCGGFPCQDLSVAGNRAGLAGERSGLFFEFMRIAGALAPDWVVIENVPGLLSSNEGGDMGTVLGTLADLGYGWAYRVLDAQYFGVAQRRRRVFIVGCLGGPARAASVLFERESCDGDSAPSRDTGTRVAGTLAACAGSGGLSGIGQSRSSTTSRIAEGATSIGMGVAFSENQRGELLETDISHQLTAGGGKPGQGYPAVRQGLQVRRLTPRECERLQGFPDGWTDELSDSGRYRVLGNAVAVPVAEWIGTRLMAHIDALAVLL